VIGPYVAIVRAPHVARLMASTMVYGVAATGTLLPLVFFAREATGSFSGASAVLAGDAVGAAIGSPVRGRLVDQHGPRRSLPLFALALVATMGALIAAGREHASLFVLVPLSFLVGLVAQTPGVVLRAIWPRITAGHERSTAFALLTVMHELTNLSGPLIGAVLLLLTAPTAAVAGGTLVAAAAMLWFARSSGVEGNERPEPRTIFSLGPLVSSGFRAVLALALCYGILFGALEDIALPAFAVEHGSRASAGILVAAIALGIAIGGFSYGLREWRQAPGELIPALSALALVGILPALVADSLPAMALAMLAFGLLVAPITTVQFAVIDDVAPAGSGTEAFGWFSSIAMAGAAGGAVLAGKLVDSSGWRAATVAVVAAAALCVVVAVVRRRPLGSRFSAELTR
jgi:predicted MFS family arabinose efflux permease